MLVKLMPCMNEISFTTVLLNHRLLTGVSESGLSEVMGVFPATQVFSEEPAKGPRSFTEVPLIFK